MCIYMICLDSPLLRLELCELLSSQRPTKEKQRQQQQNEPTSL